MKIIGIGNAIVDVICKVDDEFLSKNNLSKSNMKLIDENEFKNLLLNLKIEETISGGSVANSIVGLSQLNNHVGFIGKVSDDELGQKYEIGLKNEILPQSMLQIEEINDAKFMDYEEASVRILPRYMDMLDSLITK